jgi:Trk K+ transport system NAD-binding subunit
VRAEQPGNGDEGESEPRRFVVCGANPLALRLVDELVTRYGADVAVVLPSASAGYGPRLASLPGVELVECPRPTPEAFLRADIGAAAALALVEQDDGGNLDAALLARELNPHIRIVVRMFNAGLGSGIRRLLGDCEVLSESAIAAPAFVAAALGDDVPAFLRVPGRPLFVGRRAAVPGPDILCGIAVDEGQEATELLPADQERADVVIAASEAPAPGPVRRRPRHPLRAVALLVGRRLRIALAVLAGLIVVGTAVLAFARRIDMWSAFYQVVLTTLGNGGAGSGAGVVEQVLTVVLTVVSVALIPLLTAAVVEAAVNARLRLAAGGLAEPIQGHVVVVGLGNVGTRVIRALTDLGIEVVAVDRDEQARGVSVARELHLPLVLGDATQEQTLRAASLQTCRALVITSTGDVDNLETALLGRNVHPGVRVVVRLFDGDFAERVQRNFHINASRSVSYLAAPSFAAAMLGQQVVDVIPVRRRVLLVAELPVEPGSAAEGQHVSDLNRPHTARIVGIRTGRGDQTIWSPPGGRKLVRTDRLVVVATRAGLSWLLAVTTPEG